MLLMFDSCDWRVVFKRVEISLYFFFFKSRKHVSETDFRKVFFGRLIVAENWVVALGACSFVQRIRHKWGFFVEVHFVVHGV